MGSEGRGTGGSGKPYRGPNQAPGRARPRQGAQLGRTMRGGTGRPAHAVDGGPHPTWGPSGRQPEGRSNRMGPREAHKQSGPKRPARGNQPGHEGFPRRRRGGRRRGRKGTTRPGHGTPAGRRLGGSGNEGGDERTEGSSPDKDARERERRRRRRAGRSRGGRRQRGGPPGGERCTTVSAAGDAPAASTTPPGRGPRPQGVPFFRPRRRQRARRPPVAPIGPAGGRTPTPGSRAAGWDGWRWPDRGTGRDAVAAGDGAARSNIGRLGEVSPRLARRDSRRRRRGNGRGGCRRAGRGRGQGRGRQWWRRR